MEYIHSYDSPLGKLTLAATDQGLSGLWLEGQKYFAASLSPEHEEKALPVFDETAAWLDTYFRGEKPDLLPPLDLHGSPFRRAVWEILLAIPYGQVTTYGEIAKQLSEKSGRTGMSAQAVGGAVGHNPVSILVPCHRVVGADGSLTGYAGDVEKKLWLLKLEGVDTSKLFLPKRGTAL